MRPQSVLSFTHIVVIMLATMEHLQATVEVWMDLVVGNARRYIDVSALYKKLGPKISEALPALHAFTGCDFNPALYRRGKKKPLQFLMSSEIFQKVFLDLGSKEHNVQDPFNIIPSFTCHLYVLKKLDDVNQAGIVIFNKTYKVKDKSKPFSLSIQNYDACHLPPCQSTSYSNKCYAQDSLHACGVMPIMQKLLIFYPRTMDLQVINCRKRMKI
jgi:hypothetical protein